MGLKSELLLSAYIYVPIRPPPPLVGGLEKDGDEWLNYLDNLFIGMTLGVMRGQGPVKTEVFLKVGFS